jgi:hypothetical protein
MPGVEIASFGNLALAGNDAGLARIRGKEKSSAPALGRIALYLLSRCLYYFKLGSVRKVGGFEDRRSINRGSINR